MTIMRHTAIVRRSCIFWYVHLLDEALTSRARTLFDFDENNGTGNGPHHNDRDNASDDSDDGTWVTTTTTTTRRVGNAVNHDVFLRGESSGNSGNGRRWLVATARGVSGVRGAAGDRGAGWLVANGGTGDRRATGFYVGRTSLAVLIARTAFQKVRFEVPDFASSDFPVALQKLALALLVPAYIALWALTTLDTAILETPKDRQNGLARL